MTQIKIPADSSQPTDTFQIEFQVDKKTGYITATQIVISSVILDVMDSARVDLADHPLYKKLQRYVKGNPR